MARRLPTPGLPRPPGHCEAPLRPQVWDCSSTSPCPCFQFAASAARIQRYEICHRFDGPCIEVCVKIFVRRLAAPNNSGRWRPSRRCRAASAQQLVDGLTRGNSLCSREVFHLRFPIASHRESVSAECELHRPCNPPLHSLQLGSEFVCPVLAWGLLGKTRSTIVSNVRYARSSAQKNVNS